MSDFAMGAVIVCAVWLFLSVLATAAWASLRAEVEQRADPEPDEAPPLDLTSDLDVLLTREELRQQTLAHVLRQDVTL